MYPVLMYHKVGATVREKADSFLNVTSYDFRRQMRILTTLGYIVRPFAEIVEAIQTQQTLPRKTCAVTFDDGYACVGDYAAPILAEFGFPGTVFVVSQASGQTNAWDGSTGRPVLPLMDEDALRQLHSNGWELAGHTRTHPHLNELNDREALEEIRGGREELEAQFGVPVTTFCYPFGHYNARTPKLVIEAGFRGACTTQSGMAVFKTDPALIPRVKVASRDGVLGFLYRLLLRARYARPAFSPLRQTPPQPYSHTTSPPK